MVCWHAANSSRHKSRKIIRAKSIFHFIKHFCLWVFLLDPSVSQPVSVCRDSMEANLVAPVTIQAASFWILSNSFESYCVGLMTQIDYQRSFKFYKEREGNGRVLVQNEVNHSLYHTYTFQSHALDSPKANFDGIKLYILMICPSSTHNDGQISVYAQW